MKQVLPVLTLLFFATTACSTTQPPTAEIGMAEVAGSASVAPLILGNGQFFSKSGVGSNRCTGSTAIETRALTLAVDEANCQRNGQPVSCRLQYDHWPQHQEYSCNCPGQDYYVVAGLHNNSGSLVELTSFIANASVYPPEDWQKEFVLDCYVGCNGRCQ